MAIYTAGRRRTMLILLLTSILLITLDLRGNTVFNTVRSGFDYAFRPFEIAAEVVARPVTRVWRGITQVDDLEAEVRRLQETIDAQRNDQIAGANAMIENLELRALLDLEPLSNLDSITAEIIGQSPSNFDQRVEVDRGSLDGIRVGMPVINSAGLVGKVTEVFPQTAIVMLIPDPSYAVPVKVVAEVPAAELEPEPEPEPTVPSGIAVGDVTTTTSTSTTTPTTVPEGDDGGDDGDDPDGDDAGADGDDPEGGDDPVDDGDGDDGDGDDGDGDDVDTPIGATTTTTTTLPPVDVVRETGMLYGMGSERLPRVKFIVDSEQFGRVQVGDEVLTAGGSRSLAPPNLPVGWVANVIENPGSRGLELEVELSADLDRLNFLTVVLYVSPTEALALQ